MFSPVGLDLAELEKIMNLLNNQNGLNVRKKRENGDRFIRINQNSRKTLITYIAKKWQIKSKFPTTKILITAGWADVYNIFIYFL